MSLTTEQQILIEQRIGNDRKSPAVAYLLWFFLGGLAAHRFYLGRILSAVILLLLFLSGLVLSFVGIGLLLLIPAGIWWLVDAFLIPSMIRNDCERARRRLTEQMGTPPAA